MTFWCITGCYNQWGQGQRESCPTVTLPRATTPSSSQTTKTSSERRNTPSSGLCLSQCLFINIVDKGGNTTAVEIDLIKSMITLPPKNKRHISSTSSPFWISISVCSIERWLCKHCYLCQIHKLKVWMTIQCPFHVTEFGQSGGKTLHLLMISMHFKGPS